MTCCTMNQNRDMLIAHAPAGLSRHENIRRSENVDRITIFSLLFSVIRLGKYFRFGSHIALYYFAERVIK